MRAAGVISARLIGMMAAVATTLGCVDISSSAGAADQMRYDGTLSGFEAFVEANDKPWPLPAALKTFKTYDGASLRYAYWPAPDPDRLAGVVVFFSGRTEFIEKNIYAYQDLLDRNFDVWTLDWRGQGLSARLLPDEPEKGHIDNYETYLTDAEVFLRDVVKLRDYEGRPRILLAHSMGGTIGTLYLLRHPKAFTKAVFSAPLITLPSGIDNALIRTGNKAKISIKPSVCTGINPFADCLWQSDFKEGIDVCALTGDQVPKALLDRGHTERYTHDLIKAAEIECWIASSRSADRSLGLGGPTSGWLRETYQATDRLNAEKSGLKTPLLIIGGGQDQIVSNDGQAKFCDEGNPACCRLEIAEAGHELLIERKPIKNRFFKAFDAFVGGDETPAAFCASRR